jgi:hypothetical protein
MSFTLTKTYPRLWSLEEGTAMVVTDLHGDGDAYQRYRDRFVDLHAAGRADCLILAGDLIHAEDTATPDHSLDMVLDVLALRDTYGAAIIYLCGNHEIPHIYSFSLSKGDRVYTPDFEAAMVNSGHREDIMALFNSLPFYIRTKAGVSLTHAGASPATISSDNARKLFEWSHLELMNWAKKLVAGEDVTALRIGFTNSHQGIPYNTIANYLLSISGPNDPRYNDLLHGFFASNYPLFRKLLWPALFTRCEQEYGPADYAIFLDALLKELSADYSPQQLLITGHIPVRGGHQVATKRNLRLASATHASPRTAGQYLLFDAANPINDIKDLTQCFGSVYE